MVFTITAHMDPIIILIGMEDKGSKKVCVLTFK